MNNKISAAVGFIAGVGAGFASCYVIFKKKNEATLDAKVESIKNTYEKLGGAIKNENKTEDAPKRPIDNTTEDVVKAVVNKVSIKKEDKTEESEDDDEDDTEYDDYETDEDYISTYYEDIVKSYKDDDPIQLITMEEYESTVNGYDKRECTYYCGDEDHIVDVDTGHELDNWDSLLGYEHGLLNEDLFEEYDGIVYIRNNSMCTDYMITRSYSSFS